MFAAIERFRQRLREGQVLIGAGVGLADAQASEALADSVDFLWIDLEHSAMGPEALRGHLLAARSRGTPAVVRVAGGGAAVLKPVLDAGAGGVIVPQVRSAGEVEQVVADCRYPPEGRRGFGPLIPTNYGRADTREYVERANRLLLVAVMIETEEAVAAIEAIAAVRGLDAVVLGPWDLSGSLGLLGQVDHPRVVAAMERVIAAARRAGLFVGSGMGADPAFACAQARRGVQWLQVGGDCAYLVRSADQLTRAIHAELEDRVPR